MPLVLRILYACIRCRRIYVHNVRWQFGVPAICPECAARGAT